MLRIAVLLASCAFACGVCAAAEDWRVLWSQERHAEADAALQRAFDSAVGDPAARTTLIVHRALLRIEAGDGASKQVDAWIEEAAVHAGAANVAARRTLELLRARVDAERAQIDQAKQRLANLGELDDRLLDASLRVPILRLAQTWTEGLTRIDQVLEPLRAGDADDAWLQRRRAQMLMERCYALRALARVPEATTACTEALSIVRRATPRAANLEARVLYVLAYARLTAGDTAASIRLQNEALERLRSHPDADARFVTRLLQSLCEDLSSSGAFDDAERRCAEAEANELAHPSPSVTVAASISMARGEIARSQSQWDVAVEHFRAGLALLESRAGPNHPYAAVMLTNMGHALVGGNRFDEAVGAHQRALTIMTALLGPDNPELIGPLSGQIAADLRRGRFADAEASARRALQLIGRAATTMYDWEIRLHHSLARALWGQQRMPAALAALHDAQRVRRTLMARNIEELPERRSLQYRDRYRFVDDVQLAVVALNPTPAAIAELWQAQIATRGLVTAAVAQRLAQLRGESDPGVRALHARWRELRREANAAPAKARVSSERKVDRAEERLAEQLTSVAAARAERNTHLATIVAALPPRSALVSFASTRVDDARLDSDHRRDPTWYALIQEYGGAKPRLVDLGRGADLETPLDAWLASLRDPRSPLAEVRARGSLVHRRLWQPLQLAADTELVFVVPEGSLHGANLAALPDGDGWLAERGPRFHVLEHERDLLRPTSSGVAGNSALLVGAPDLAGAGSALAANVVACGGMRVLPLDGARREIAGISALLKEAGYDQVSTFDSAGETAVRKALSGQRIVHFATHGVAWDSDCAGSGQRLLTVAPAAGKAASGILQAGLILGTVEDRSARATDDGILSTDEVAIADLSSTDLAVLSACDTGRGRLVDGEGVIGLARAFRLAGARRTVVSLWAVEDEATAEFMGAFYRAYLQPGTHVDQALRAAQQAVLAEHEGRESRQHPFYWAAFVARGEWR